MEEEEAASRVTDVAELLIRQKNPLYSHRHTPSARMAADVLNIEGSLHCATIDQTGWKFINPDNKNPEITVLLVGTAGAGKTSWIRLIGAGMQPQNNNFLYKATIGCDFLQFRRQRTVDEHQFYTIKVWDTSGDFTYSNILVNAYNNAEAVILVIDATNMFSLSTAVHRLADIQRARLERNKSSSSYGGGKLSKLDVIIYLNKWGEEEYATTYELEPVVTAKRAEKTIKDPSSPTDTRMRFGILKRIVTPRVMEEAFKASFQKSAMINNVYFYSGSLVKTPAIGHEIYQFLVQHIVEPRLFAKFPPGSNLPPITPVVETTTTTTTETTSTSSSKEEEDEDESASSSITSPLHRSESHDKTSGNALVLSEISRPDIEGGGIEAHLDPSESKDQQQQQRGCGCLPSLLRRGRRRAQRTSQRRRLVLADGREQVEELVPTSPSKRHCCSLV